MVDRIKNKAGKLLTLTDEEILHIIKTHDPEQYAILKKLEIPDSILINHMKKMAKDILSDRTTNFIITKDNGEKIQYSEYLGEK